MKRFLRALLNWMDRKFPDRVTVTQEIYDGLIQAQTAQSNHIIELRRKIGELESGNPALKELQGKLEAHQNEINKFNIALGFMPLGLTKAIQDTAMLQR